MKAWIDSYPYVSVLCTECREKNAEPEKTYEELPAQEVIDKTGYSYCDNCCKHLLSE